MGIVPEGLKLVCGGAVAVVLGGLICVWSRWIGVPVLALGALFVLFTAYFFRDPVRDKVFAPGAIACPADGTVLSVRTEDDPNVTVVRMML